MAKNEKFNEEDGVWRTIGGRRVFIRNGQSLSEAMIESGKFKNLRSEYRKAKEEEKKQDIKEKENKNDGEYAKNKSDFYNKLSAKEKEKYDDYLAQGYTQSDIENTLMYKTMEQRMEEADIWEKQPDGTFLANKDAMKKQYEENHKNYDAKIKQFAEDRKNMTNGDWEGMLMAYEQQNADGTYKTLQDIMDDVDKYEKENGKGTGDFELTDNNFKNNWQDEIKTKEQLLEKEKEVKEQYENYKELVAKNNWNSTTVAKNEESYKKILQNIEDWKKEFDAQEQGFTQHNTQHGGTREYTKEEVDKMAESGTKPMKDSYSGYGWEGVNSDKNLSTKEQAKAITDAMKKKYPDVKISRKSELYSGGSSIHLDIMSSDKDLYVTDFDIDKMSLDDLAEVRRSNGFNWWARDNVQGYKDNKAMFTDKDVKEYAKKRLAEMKKGDNQSVRGDEWYLSDYGKKVVSDLNKEANSYTYDDSDGMTDYFNHGTYMWINIGKYDKPYQVNEKSTKSTNETMNKAIREKVNDRKFKASMGEVDIPDDFEAQFNDYAKSREKASSNNDNKSIKQLNNEMLGNTYKGKGQTPDLVYSNGRRIDIANNENGGKTATIWKDGKIERKTNLPENVSGDKTKDYFDKYLKELDDMSSNNNQISNSLREKAYKKYLKEHPGSKLSFSEYKKMRG